MKNFSLDIERDKFLDEYFGKNIYLSRRSADITNIGWSTVDASLFGWPTDDGSLVLYNNGRIAVESYTEKYLDVAVMRTRIVKDIFYSIIEEGATLVLNKINSRIPEVNDVCRQVSKYLGVKCNANGYAAFGGDGSFGKHWDTHDVFAIQIVGKKLWKIYSPTFEKPLAHQNSKDYTRDCPTSPVLEVILEPGDVLYLPRGWWHEALPIPTEESFHIAVGLFPPKIMDYLLWTAGNKMPNHLVGRQALSGGGEGNDVISAFVARLKDEMLSRQTISEFFSSVSSSDRAHSRFNIGQILGDRNEHRGESRLVSVFSPVTAVNDKTVVVNGVSIKLDENTHQFLEQILRHDEEEKCYETIIVTDEDFKALKFLIQLDVIEAVLRPC